MDTKKVVLIPTVALTLWTGSALAVTARPAEAKISVKISARPQPAQAIAPPFILYQSPAVAAKPPVKAAKGQAVIKGQVVTKDQSNALTELMKTVLPSPITGRVRQNVLNKDTYIAVLTSTDPLDAAVVTEATAKAQAVLGSSVLVVSNIRSPDPAVPHTPDPPVTRIYTLRFLRGPVAASDGTTAGDPEIDAFGTDKAAQDLADFLSKFYSGADKVTVQARENHLILTGPSRRVNALRQMLALSLDVPSPQVKADVYTIQVNTTPHNRDAAQDKIEEIQAGIQIVRDLIHGSELALGAYLASPAAQVENLSLPQYSPGVKQRLFDAMQRDGYDPSPHRPLSLTDMLILLAASDRKQFQTDLIPDHPLANALEKELFSVRRLVTSGNSSLVSARYKVPNATAYTRHSQGLGKLLDRIETKVMQDGKVELDGKKGVPVFRRLAGAYNPPSDNSKPPGKSMPADSDLEGMIQFLDAWHECQGTFLDAPNPAAKTAAEGVDPREYPDHLSNKSAATDLLLKEAMDALTADLQDLYFQPLLDWIREDVRGTNAKDSGIDLVGTTSITVRDRMLVKTQGTADSYFKYTPIPHLTMSALTGAKSDAAGAAATPDTTTQHVATDAKGVVHMANGDPLLLTPGQQLALDPASGLALRKGDTPAGDPVVLTVPNTSQTKSPSALAATVFGALTPLQELALQAVFSEDAVLPSFRKISPGTSLAIRPFVLPDGGSARIQMGLTSTVDADAPDTTKRDIPFDVIAKQTVTTEATISAFDLETVSSFDVQTTAPGDYVWRIPVLDQIPLLGDLFHGPRARETKRQDSIAIVNLTILPRSLDLVPYYVDSPPPPAAPKSP